ncbi:ribonuclease Z [Candidatus Bathyarchaeota archaeon]|nr:MAG: ribonuclease Z [Candidatus Bathyarchaeota archaeon]
MSLRVLFLGTSASVPTLRRSLPAIAIRREGELILFDCGEGTQRQMIKAKVGFNRETRIFITHMHGDHMLGLPGVIQTMSLLDRSRPLYIYGPEGIRDFIEAIRETVRFSLRFRIEVQEVTSEGVIYDCNDYEVRAGWSEHTVPTVAYALIEKQRPGRFNPERALSLGVPKGPLWSRLQRGLTVELPNGRIVKPEDVLGPPRRGRKIVYTGDTRPSRGIIELAKGADVLIHDATFADDLAERAREDMHSTASEAASVAKEAGVGLLVLTHISARYEDTDILLEEARRIFPNVLVAEDFMSLDVPLPE